MQWAVKRRGSFQITTNFPAEARKGLPLPVEYIQMVRKRISEKKFGSEAFRQARLILFIFFYSLVTAALAAIFFAIGYFLYPALAHLWVGDENALFKAHMGLYDAGFWLRISLFECSLLFIIHLLVGIFTTSALSLKRSFLTAGSLAILFIFVMVETSSFYYPILFLPATACVFLLRPLTGKGQ